MKALDVLAAVAVVGGVVTSHGGVTNVTAGGPLYGTITQAVAAAGASARLLVSTGLYREAVVISAKTLVIEGGYFATFAGRTNNNACTAVTPPAASSVLTMRNGARVTLDGFSLTGGVALAGGGMSVEAGCVLTALNCTVAQNLALGGGGIYADSNSVVVISNSVVAGNHALWYGGGVMAYNTARVVVRGPGALIYGNDALEGAGVYAERRVGLTIEGGAQVFANIAARRGGGIVVADKSHALIRERDTKVGGFFIFYNQVTNGDGGGIYAVNASVVVSGENCRVAHNGAVGNGGGVWLSNSTLQVVDGAAIGGAGLVNVALQDGGGVHMQHSTLLLSNRAAICNSSAATNGGGIMAYESVIMGMDQAAIGESVGVAGNQAYNGAGVFLVSSSAMFVRARLSGNTAASAGGAIAAVGTSDLACTETSIAGNTATNYGACVFSGMYGGARFDNCLIMSNVARETCGGIFSFMTEPLVLTNGTRLVHNEAGVNAGGLVLVGGRAAVEGSEVAYNRARRVAGGILLFPFGRLTVCDSDVQCNQAEQGGGVYAAGGELRMRALSRACGMQSNSAVHGGGVYASGGTRIMCEAAPPHVLMLGGNTALTNGGWLYASTGVTAIVAGNVLIEGNWAEVGGAAVVLTNCVLEVWASNGAAPAVSGNVAGSAGGAVVALDRGARVILRNANVRGNISRGTASIYGGGAILAGTHSTVEASDCLFEGNISSNLGGAISAFGTPRRIAIGSTFSGAPGVLPASRFGGNYARTHGGALCVLGCVETEVANTLMVSNAAGLSGGAILFGESYTGRVVNTIFTRNWAGANGDAVAAGEFYQFEMQQCTIADNHSNGVANISTTMGTPLLENCIVWGHITSQIWGTATVRFSDVQGGYPGLFNLDTNPVFFAPGALRYDLAESSPCIDKGATLFMITNDCIGTVRPYGAGWDMGAYEFVPEPGGLWGMLAIGFTIYDVRFTNGRRRKGL